MSRISEDRGAARFSCGDYTIECCPVGLPLTYDSLKKHAQLIEEFELMEEGELCCITAKRKGEPWPFLVVAQRYWPHGAGFEPGVLLSLNTKILFVGAGERILAYDLERVRKLWEDSADTGFYNFELHQNVVLLSAELEFAAWDTSARKLWTTFVEPPWEYRVINEVVELDVMGAKQSFPLISGPPKQRAIRG